MGAQPLLREGTAFVLHACGHSLCYIWLQVSDWQTMSGGEAYWAAVLKQTCALHGLDSPGAMGMLIPTTPSAAGNHNLWDIALLKAQVQAAGIKHVG